MFENYGFFSLFQTPHNSDNDSHHQVSAHTEVFPDRSLYED